MALNSKMIWEVRGGLGDSTNGGGFNPSAAGTDRSQQNAAQVFVDNSAITATTAGANSNVLTFTAGYTPSAADVGNIFNAASGTNINAGFYEITAQTSTTWTVTGATNLTTAGGAGSAVVGKMGGALAGMGAVVKSAGGMVSGNTVWVKAATYSITAAITIPSGATGLFCTVAGYNATRGDLDTVNDFSNFPLVHATTAIDCFNVGSNYWWVKNLKFDSTGTAGRGFNGTNGSGQLENCYFTNFATVGALVVGTTRVHRCRFTAMVSGATAAIQQQSGNGVSIRACVFDANPCPGLRITGTAYIEDSLIVNNTGTSSDGVLIAGSSLGVYLRRNTISGNGGHGVNVSVSGAMDLGEIFSNVIANHTGTGKAGISSATTVYGSSAPFDYNAFYNNAADRSNVSAGAHDVALSADPFTNAASNDFTLNTTAGGGSACRATGFPGTLPGLTSNIGYRDIGALQHADPAGGGGFRRITFDGGF